MKSGIRWLGIMFSLFPLVGTAQVFDARSMGRAGTGITFGDYNQSLTNPALINNVRENDDFAFGVNAGAIASDQDEAIDTIDQIQEDVDELEQNCSSTSPCQPSDADPIIQKMRRIDRQLIQAVGGGAALVGVPLSGLNFAVTAEASAHAGARFELEESDVEGGLTGRGELGRIAVGAPNSDQDDLDSSVAASALRLDEVSGILGGKFREHYAWGAQVKFQKLELMDYSARIAAFEGDDVLDARNTKEHSSANLDLGFVRQPEGSGFSFGGTVTNLIPQTFSGPRGADLEQDPQFNVAGGWRNAWFKSELGMELNSAAGFDILKDTRFARAGVELSAGRHAHLRAGYRTDLEDNVSDLYTVGLGISPFDTVSLDLAGMVGEGDTYGAALQLGLKF
jgi:hypothetical protein